jgi:hypothetical protein
VCAGDSNTRGQYAVSYVKMLTDRMKGHDVAVTGAGVNGDCSYNLLQRLDPIIAQRPDAVTLLIGSNDAWSTLSEANARAIVKRKNLPVPPTLSGYSENLAAIVARLRAGTDAQITLVSLPVLGQDLDSPAAQASKEFSRLVMTIASEQGWPIFRCTSGSASTCAATGPRSCRSPTGSASAIRRCCNTSCCIAPTTALPGIDAWR